MKKINHYLTQEDKNILENYLIYHKRYSKQNFEVWIKNLFSNYGIENTDNSRSVYSAKYEINLIWDDKTVAQHFFSHRKFKPSNNKMTCFEKFHPDWSRLDNKGNNILHTAAKYDPHYIKIFYKKAPITLNDKGKTFHFVAFENIDTTPLVSIEKKHDFFELNSAMNCIKFILNCQNSFINKQIYTQISRENLHQYINLSNKIVPALEKFCEDSKQHIIPQAYRDYITSVENYKTQTNWLKLGLDLDNKENKKPKVKI